MEKNLTNRMAQPGANRTAMRTRPAKSQTVDPKTGRARPTAEVGKTPPEIKPEEKGKADGTDQT